MSTHIVIGKPLKRTRDLHNIVVQPLQQNFGVDHINIQIEEECFKTNDIICYNIVQ